MKDSELRGLVLQEFYTKRRDGHIMIGTDGGQCLEIPGIDEQELLRISGQLAQYFLIEWQGEEDTFGKPMFGVGKISALGVDVIEGEQKAPLPIHIDQSHNVQNIHIEGQNGGVQVAGAQSHQNQSIEQDIGKLISAVNGANVSEAAKQEAKGLLAKFLQSSAASSIFGSAVTALLKHCGV